jgi:hypothetical protein
MSGNPYRDLEGGEEHPMLEARLAARAADYVSGHLVAMRYLVGTDPEGYTLALALARVAGPDVAQLVRERLRPLVDRSIDVGQQPPEGWQPEQESNAPPARPGE